MCVTLLCIHVPTSTSIIITIITINICLKSNTIFQFSSPRFCPFWLRNMYKMSNSTTISSACELWLEARSAKYIPPHHDTKRDLRGPSNDRNSGQALIATEGIYQNKRKSPWRDMLMFCLFSRLFWVINVEINAKSFLFMDSSLVGLKQQITISSLIKLSMSPEQID